ncbi:MAG: TonB-dependent receptor plug domain-containing protein [Alphaproteobacteria bacterium]|nr:TonB-dependent receptor plug domain-containing protein [Alphaproteobacteria bacterium]
MTRNPTRILLLALMASSAIPHFATAQEAAEEPGDAGKQSDTQRVEDTIVVTGARAEGYLVSNPDVLGLGLSQREAPASVSVLSDQLLEDFGARNLATTVPFAPGVTNADNGGIQQEVFTIRGFRNDEFYINGIRQAVRAEGRRPIETIERVQVLKGPAGVEGSVTAPGGFVNIVTKKPQDDFSAVLFGGFGDENYLRVGGDVTGPVFDQNLSGRLITSFEREQFWRNGNDDRPRFTVAPSLLWNVTPDTDLLIEYEYNWVNDPLDRGVTFLRGAGLEDDFLPRTFSIHQNDDELISRTHRIDLDLKHRFNDVFSARFHYQRLDQELEADGFRNGEILNGASAAQLDDGLTFSGDPTSGVNNFPFDFELASNTFQLDLTAEFEFGATEHRVNAGGSLAEFEETFLAPDQDFIYDFFVAEIDIFNVDNDVEETTNLGPVVLPRSIRGDDIESIFGQWLGRWTDRFRTVATVRFDSFSFEERESFVGIGEEALNLLGAETPPPVGEPSGFDDNLVSYRLAGSYDLTDSLTGFAGYASSAQPQQGFTRDGGRIDPVTAKSIEGGLKLTLNSGRALATLTGYHIEQDDIALSDPTNDPAENFLLPLGGAEITGLELELAGKLTRDFGLYGGLAYQDSEITASDDPVVGNSFPNVPKF